MLVLIFGFLINLPIVFYYEIGTALTTNHTHAAMFGVYGMLAIGRALIVGILPVVTLVFHTFMDTVILLLSDILCVMLSMPLARHLWNTPVNFLVPHLGGVTEKGI